MSKKYAIRLLGRAKFEKFVLVSVPDDASREDLSQIASLIDGQVCGTELQQDPDDFSRLSPEVFSANSAFHDDAPVRFSVERDEAGSYRVTETHEPESVPAAEPVMLLYMVRPNDRDASPALVGPYIFDDAVAARRFLYTDYVQSRVLDAYKEAFVDTLYEWDIDPVEILGRDVGDDLTHDEVEQLLDKLDAVDQSRVTEWLFAYEADDLVEAFYQIKPLSELKPLNT